MESSLDEWKKNAKQMQNICFETLGTRPYVEINKSNLFLLTKNVGFGSCGEPNELPKSSNYFIGYSQYNIENINRICHQIIEQSDFDPIQFSSIFLMLYQNGEQSQTTVFKIGNRYNSVFIDTNSRVYKDWVSFMKNNKLPPCDYCYPENGDYYGNVSRSIKYARSPACKLKNRAVDCIDTVGTVAGVGAGVVVAAGTCVAVAPAAMAAAGATMIGTAAYSLVRSVHSLYDRKKHDQSIGLKDRESRSEWLSIASSTVGAVTFKAFSQAAKMQAAGKSLSRMASIGLGTLSATSLFFSGFGFIQSVSIFKDKYKEGTLTKKDIFDLSCEFLFLFNAIACAKASAELVKNVSTANIELPQAQRTLTKTQKRNLRKRMAKQRAKGLVVPTAPIENEKGTNIFRISPVLLCGANLLVSRLNVEEISLKFQEIAYNVVRWKKNEISFSDLIQNVTPNIYDLYNRYREEINEIKNVLIKFVNSIKFDRVLSYLKKSFETATSEFKNIFCNKVINAEDKIEKLINESEEEIADLHNRLELHPESSKSGNIDSGDLDDDVNELSPEIQKILSSCESLTSDSLPCNDINDFGVIFEGVYCIIVTVFKKKKAKYTESLKAAKSACGASFDIDVYHRMLNIDGNVSQHYFNEVLEEISDDDIIYKIKTKIQEMKKPRHINPTQVWETACKEIFPLYGPHGAGYLDRTMIFKIVSDTVRDIPKPLDECKFVQSTFNARDNNPVPIVIIQTESEPDMNIIVFQDIVADNTAQGLIFVIT